jgi:RNA polymerase sigma-70 factor, ECF subfamily
VRAEIRSRKWLVRLSPEFVAFATAICGSRDQAEDIAQEAIVRALAAPALPASEAELRPFVFRIIRNLAIDQLRKARVRTEYVESHGRLLGETRAAGADPLDGLVVRQAFEAVSPAHREILFLIDVMGLSYAEAAGVLAVPEGTVMSRISRARRAMMDIMDGSNVTRLAPSRRSGTRR